MDHIQVIYLGVDNIEEVSRKTGRSAEELRGMLSDAMAAGKVWKFTVWNYDKKVGEE